jgi:hypothetical protein
MSLRHSYSRSPGTQLASDLQATPGGQPEGELLQDGLVQGDPYQDATDALGLPLVLMITAIPRMIVTLTVHSHGAYETLLFPED